MLGAGSWGSAVGVHLARLGHEVFLWGRDSARLEAMALSKSNPQYLPGTPFPDTLIPQSQLQDKAEIILVAIPVQALDEALALLSPPPSWKGNPWIVLSKGVERTRHRLPLDILRDRIGMGSWLGMCSGPSFAKGLADGDPTAVVLAGKTGEILVTLQKELTGANLRVYRNNDSTGVQIGAAAKNVMAIACGTAVGLGLGPNTLAALMTRGLNEMGRLIMAMGGCRDTVMGLSGLGDLVLTCTGKESRNRQVGVALGTGKKLEPTLKELGQVAEGVFTAQALGELANQYGVDMPVVSQVVRLLAGQESPGEAVSNLLHRPLISEFESGGDRT